MSVRPTMGAGRAGEERAALGAFLRSRRGRVRPEALGLPAGARRTPGLRREEVAALSGVSVSWYTWLEQGRDIRPSAAAPRRIAGVLRLDRVETAHLFALALPAGDGASPGPVGREASALPADTGPGDGLPALVRAMDPIPAYVRNARFDVLCWNDAVAALFVDYALLPPAERNTLRLMFLHPPYRALIVDWEGMARRYLAAFRAARARASAAARASFDVLATELSAASAEFRDWWREADVDVFDQGSKQLRHPTLGTVSFTYVALAPEGRPELSLVAYVPRPADGGERRSG